MLDSKIDLENMRSEYMQKSLSEEDVDKNPINQFQIWFQEAVNSKLKDANACTLATCGKDFLPQARVVLLKRYDEEGFIFFTNYTSLKANNLKDNPNACINFSWLELERQIRINGVCEKIPTAESISYFATRSRGSQIGAWVSEQSKIIQSREILKLQVAKMRAKFQNRQIPLPDFWGGYRLRPQKIEFWQGRENRLHDRILYTLEKGEWKISRLAP